MTWSGPIGCLVANHITDGSNGLTEIEKNSPRCDYNNLVSQMPPGSPSTGARILPPKNVYIICSLLMRSQRHITYLSPRKLKNPTKTSCYDLQYGGEPYTNVQFVRHNHQGNIGFIGIGNMGGPMAINLAKAGYTVHIFDKCTDRLKGFRGSAGQLQDRVHVANSMKDILRKDVENLAMVTMLPASPQVLEVYGVSLADAGLISLAPPHTLFIDCTTGDPEAAKRVSIYAAQRNCSYIDAPVSGGVPAAQNASLTFMVGGKKDDVSRAMPILQAMGKQVFHCGGLGAGLATKICNNMLLGITMIATSETMELGRRLGLDLATLTKVINCSSGRCWSSEVYNPVPMIDPNLPSSNGYSGGFGAALMLKDLGLAQTASIETGSPTFLGALSRNIYQIMCQNGYSQKDFSSVFEFLSKKE